ncbi:MAG: translation initiation factor IF-2 [Candidatus Omnitrophica bacterium]|nr:translation initiation factor IF-2 [Candidatus Omnitrophota bacterium]
MKKIKKPKKPKALKTKVRKASKTRLRASSTKPNPVRSKTPKVAAPAVRRGISNGARKAKKPAVLRKEPGKKQIKRKEIAPKPKRRVSRKSKIQAKTLEPQPQQLQAILVEEAPQAKVLELDFPISVKNLAVKLQIKLSQLMQELLKLKILANINQSLGKDEVEQVCENFGFKVKQAPSLEERLLSLHEVSSQPQDLNVRPPVVTFMGHVDHGKTSLLDMIRKTKVVDFEHGGITQHIGAYEVNLDKGKIAFLDTPGHEAFTAMRARGAQITDIVVLVVAADDGVMPQTIEAINHARDAEVPIIVAINKVDRVQANVDRVKKQLADIGLVPEEWQGKTVTVEVSAKTGQGIDELLEMILLEAEMLELKADYNQIARGVVIEARQDPNRGPLATLLVQNGKLHLNDLLVAGKNLAKVKAIFNDCGQRVEEATASQPVGILGFESVPEAGERFFVVKDEKGARALISLRETKEKRNISPHRFSLEDLHQEIKNGVLKELKIIIKADTFGSLEAVRDSLIKLETKEVKFKITHKGVGLINTSDVMLASVSDALILGFHINIEERAKELIKKEQVEVRTYNIIYELVEEIKAALEGLLSPKIKKVSFGQARVKQVFNLSRSGVVAGCTITKGKILRTLNIDIIRDNTTIFSGKISNLRRFKDEVSQVSEGYECGISIGNFSDYKIGDIMEGYKIEKIARKL